MEKDINIIKSNFRNSSTRISHLIYEDFIRSVKKLDRQRDENVFRQLQSRYRSELEKQLNAAAEKVIGEYGGHNDMRTLQRELTNQISYNVSEFLLKIKSM